MWEYRVIEIPGDRVALIDKLVELGKQGWQAWSMSVARNRWTVYLKREAKFEVVPAIVSGR